MDDKDRVVTYEIEVYNDEDRWWYATLSTHPTLDAAREAVEGMRTEGYMGDTFRVMRRICTREVAWSDDN